MLGGELWLLCKRGGFGARGNAEILPRGFFLWEFEKIFALRCKRSCQRKSRDGRGNGLCKT